METRDYYRQYLNVVKMVTDKKYRGHTLDGVLKQEDFNKKLAVKEFVMHCITDINTALLFIKEGSAYTTVKAKFDSLITGSTKNLSAAYVFVGGPVNKSIMKFIAGKNKEKPRFIQFFPLKHFNCEPHLAPHCSVHSIMSPEEVERELLVHHRVMISSLPQIRENDPPCLWLGAVSGQVVRILRRNTNSGLEVTFRVVVKGAERKEALDKPMLTEKKETSDAEEEETEEPEEQGYSGDEFDEEEPAEEEAEEEPVLEREDTVFESEEEPEDEDEEEPEEAEEETEEEEL